MHRGWRSSRSWRRKQAHVRGVETLGVFMSQVDSRRDEWPVEHRTSPDRTLDTPPLRSMLSTAELSRRPSRPPDHAAETEALIELARVMATSPDAILQKLAETALRLCRAHSAGLSLLEEGDQRSNFHWRAIAGQWAPHLNGEHRATSDRAALSATG